MESKKLKVIFGNKEFYFVFLTPPLKDQLIDDGGAIYEITNVKHKQAVTRKPTEEEYEEISKDTSGTLHVELIEVEPAETIVYVSRIKNL
jgi:hypothetical protein